jgi:hypothetical protein
VQIYEVQTVLAKNLRNGKNKSTPQRPVIDFDRSNQNHYINHTRSQWNLSNGILKCEQELNGATSKVSDRENFLNETAGHKSAAHQERG